MNVQDIVDQTAQAKVTEGGNNIRDGKYRFVIERVFVRKGHEGVCVIPELRVLRCEKTEPDTEPNPVGSNASCVWNYTKHPETAPGNAKTFLLTVLGLETNISEEDFKKTMAWMLSPEQPFRGMEVDCVTYQKMNQGKKNPNNRGQMMTLPKWKHVAGQNKGSIAANRATLDGDAPAAAPAAAPPPAAPVAAAPTTDYLSRFK